MSAPTGEHGGAPSSTSLASLVVWGLFAAALLALGFLSYVYLASLLANRGGDAEAARRMQSMLALYARVVLVKGLLPQLGIALALWPFADRRFGLESRGWMGIVAGLFGVALLASFAVMPLLTTGWPGLPAVKFVGAGNFLRTVLEMTSVVTVAAAIPKLAIRRWRGAAPGPS